MHSSATSTAEATGRSRSSGNPQITSDRNGDDTMASQLLSPGFVLPGRGGWPIVGAPWVYHQMAVVDREID
jgi:hypothetical protein